MKKYILALDQGTTSSRAILFDKTGKVISSCQKEFTQVFPKPGWVEHDPLEIWDTQREMAVAAMKKARVKADQIVSIGITNQRETTILWERETGKPVHNAIVWQCRRTADICKKLEAKGYGPVIRRKTGLLLDAYFSGTKVKWLLDNVPGLRSRAKRGEICFGTVDSWLLYNLTGEHATDVTNASRTLLLDIRKGVWDKELLDIFDIPEKVLPSVKPSSAFFGKTKSNIFGGEIIVGGVAGDQQASLFGQACFNTGSAKNTYGTGCFALVNIGKKFVLSKHRLLTTVAWDVGDGIEYALEGSVFIGGAVVKWLRDQQEMLKTAADSEKTALSVPDTGGVYFVPAFVGLGAPYWDSAARGTIVGLTRGSSRPHIVRAALESIAFQSRDLIAAVEEDVGHKVQTLKVDGGATVNRFLMQFQADILGIPVVCSAIPETTALGAAYLAGLHCGYWKNKEEIRKNWRMSRKFLPRMGKDKRRRLLADWKRAVEAARSFACGVLFFMSLVTAVFAAPSGNTAAYDKVKEYTSSRQTFKYVLAPEGEFITVFNDEVTPWIKRRLDADLAKKIRTALEPRLGIELNAKGFASAATRQTSGDKDSTNYDAIWVRDNVWIYYSLVADPQRKADARRLILALWDYYSTPEQITRFKNIIADPKLAADAMAMPHIRFDSNSPSLADVTIDGKPETWNHRQIDAHGIFFTALAEAFQDGILKGDDLTEARALPLALYPLFLSKIQFYAYEDAGSWEELPRKNTSSIGLATRSLQVWTNLMYARLPEKKPEIIIVREKLKSFIDTIGGDVASAWSKDSMKKLSLLGLAQVKRQLTLGGESPDYNPADIHFRLADAALLTLIVPSPLEGLSEDEMRKALTIVETLKRPAGILRYNNDSYQGGNYWIKPPAASGDNKPALTGDTSSKTAFLWRLEQLIPNTEAQWFFDSLMAMARMRLARITMDVERRRIDMHLAAIHIKRSLGQITGRGITADGEAVEAWLAPESINTVVIDRRESYLASPIAPLNWSKAALAMALRDYENAVK